MKKATKAAVPATKTLKATSTKAAKTVPAPEPQQMRHRLRQDTKPAAPVKAPKRENTFSKSRDVREDRGTRQAKSQRPQTLSRGR